MLKKTLILCSLYLPTSLIAAQTFNLYQSNLNSIDGFSIDTGSKATRGIDTKNRAAYTLHEINQSHDARQTTKRYQQLYNGIPVIGAQITLVNAKNHIALTQGNKVNGHLVRDLQLNTIPKITRAEAIALSNSLWKKEHPLARIYNNKAEIQIRIESGTQARLVYQVSFKTNQDTTMPALPYFIIDAQSGMILKQWNNIKNHAEVGPGGNEKIHEYWYGKEGLPALEVLKKDSMCIMESSQVKLIDLASAWDWEGMNNTSYQYSCKNNTEELINGAFSPRNDAYYFGHIIVDMYKKWYGVHALQHENGSPMQLIMRVHFGSHFDNAFWDGSSMTFGDGEDFYPLVSLDVAGHEVTHGFTEQHANLEYHDQSGALNESFSDMAGQASRAFLLEEYPALYSKAYLANSVTWGIGETVMRGTTDEALRYMDFPSKDFISADCLDKNIAQKNGASCYITYADVEEQAKARFFRPEDIQSYIVHTGSGIFNKAFYLMSQHLGIKKTYHMMLLANSQYWTPDSDFNQGACGVLYAARDLDIEETLVHSSFAQVGIDTKGCLKT